MRRATRADRGSLPELLVQLHLALARSQSRSPLPKLVEELHQALDWWGRWPSPKGTRAMRVLTRFLEDRTGGERAGLAGFRDRLEHYRLSWQLAKGWIPEHGKPAPPPEQ